MATNKKRRPKLPFVVQPRRKPITEVLGSDESGKVEIKRMGYLTVAEKMYVQSTVMADGSIAHLHRLAARIAKETGRDAQVVMTEIPEQHDYLEPYSVEIGDTLTMMLSYQEKLKVVSVAALLSLRVNDEITIEEVMDLHPDLMEDIYRLYQDEERKSMEAFEKEEDEVEGGAAPVEQSGK